MTKFLNISVDNALGGNSPSDVVVSSQKAVKEYIDAHSGGGGGTAVLEALYPVGSVYITTANTCPLSVLISGSTWTLKSSGVVTSVNTSVPVKGTGISLGWSDGTHKFGVTKISSTVGFAANVGNYGKTVGSTIGDVGSPLRTVWGITTDASKSGIVGTVTRTILSVNIFERTA